MLAVIVFCLLRPALILKAAVPQQNFLGVLRGRFAQPADCRQRRAPAQRVRRRQPRRGPAAAQRAVEEVRPALLPVFSSADRLQSTTDLKYEGTTTRLGGALDRARDELAGLPLAGLVMVTDGADTSDAAIDESIASLKARSIPVFTVGVGQERFARDVQVTRVETPRSVLKGTSLVVNVVLTQTGYAGAKVPLNVEDEGRIVGTQEVTLPPDGESATVRVRFTASDAGPARLPLQRAGAGQRAGHAEQRARGADRGQRPAREDPVLRRRAALRNEVHPARGRRRQEPAGRPPAAHRREQVPAPRRRQRRRARGRLSEDARTSCSRIARSSWAASKRPRSRPTSSG